MEPIIRSTAQPECWAILDETFSAHNVAPNTILRVDSFEVIKSMILNGIGISFLPELSISAELAAGDLVVLRPTIDVELHRDIVVSYLKRQRPTYLDRFLSIIQKIQQPYETE